MKKLFLATLFCLISLFGLAQSFTGVTASGTDTYAITVSGSSYFTNQSFEVRFTNPNTGAATLAVTANGVVQAAKAITTDGSTPVTAGQLNGVKWLSYNGTNFQIVNNSSGSGTVSTVSVVSANGLAGTVANPTTTPAITLSTTITGIPKGNGTSFSAAVAGTDYELPVMTSVGDLIQGAAAGAPVRLASVAAGGVLLTSGVGAANSWGTVSNGLTATASTLQLGGTLTGNVNINTGANTLNIVNSLDNSLTTIQDGIGTGFVLQRLAGGSYVSMNGSNLAGTESVYIYIDLMNASTQGTGAFILDARAVTKGLEYFADFSSGFTLRSLVDKGYVLGAKTYTGIQTFPSLGLAIRNPANTFSYSIQSGAIIANRTIILPILTGDDTMVTAAFAQTLTNKSISGATNTFVNIPLISAVTGILPGANGGTGVANTSKTITLGGNLTTAAAFNVPTDAAGVLTNNGSGTLTWAATGGAAWLLASGGTLTGANTIDQTTTAGNIVKFLTPTLGVTSIDGKGLWIQNATAAAAGAQQISGSIVQEGQGWATTPVTTQSVKFMTNVLPVQGAANPSASWNLASSINNGAYQTIISVTGAASATNSSITLGNNSTFVVGNNSIVSAVAANNGNFAFSIQGTTELYIGQHWVNIGNTTSSLAQLYVLQGTFPAAMPAFRVDASTKSGLTASTELLAINFNTSASVQYATGAMTQLRNILFQAPTITYVGSSVTTDMATATITGASISGTNAIGTVSTHGLLIKSASVVSGTGTALASYGSTINAQTGATNNYAGQFLGGNVGFLTSSPVSSIDVVGSFGVNLTSISTDVTLDATYHTVLVSASGANRTITLPASSGCTRRIYRIKKTDATANTVTIDGNASETIDGALTKVVNTQYSGYAIQSDGSNWSIIATF